VKRILARCPYEGELVEGIFPVGFTLLSQTLANFLSLEDAEGIVITFTPKTPARQRVPIPFLSRVYVQRVLEEIPPQSTLERNLLHRGKMIPSALCLVKGDLVKKSRGGSPMIQMLSNAGHLFMEDVKGMKTTS